VKTISFGGFFEFSLNFNIIAIGLRWAGPHQSENMITLRYRVFLKEYILSWILLVKTWSVRSTFYFLFAGVVLLWIIFIIQYGPPFFFKALCNNKRRKAYLLS